MTQTHPPHLKQVIAWFVVVFFTHYAQGADNEHGKLLFKECESCHSLERDVFLIGPSLFGIYKKRSATSTGFRYSQALKKSNIEWNDETLNVFLTNPQEYLPGNRMPYSGMPQPNDRLDLIEYLKSVK